MDERNNRFDFDFTPIGQAISVSYCKYLWTEYSSTIEFETGVPVANIVPRLPVISSR